MLTANLDILILKLNIDINIKFIYVINLYNMLISFVKAEKVLIAIFKAIILI